MLANLLKVKRKHIWIEGGNKIQQHTSSVDVQEIIVTNAQNEKYCNQTCETKSGIKGYTLWQLVQSF